ncbi:MAG: YheC/YheD family protein [Syntrophomonas sp.]|nr:YheC/YheD family protein [Syntrophomonas sp.]
MNTVGRIYISKVLMKKIALPAQSEIKVRVGSRLVNSELIIQDLKKKSYMLSPSLARALYIKKRKRMKLRYDQRENIIHLGPTIGILSTFLPNRGEHDPLSMQAELIFLSNISKTLAGQVYVFTPGSINWSNNTVRGYVYKQISPERGFWIPHIYPLPDVVYDRIPSRSSEARSLIRNTKNKLCQLPHLKYFNPSFLNKWRVYQILINDPRLHPYIPETRVLTAENLKDLLSKYELLYLKPANGSLGKGIIKVKRDEKGSLHFVTNGRRKIRSSADSVADLMKKTKIYRGKRAYIAQQGIFLASYKGLPFDLRIVYQKNAQGVWQISKSFVRVAARGSSVSNLASGGRVEKTKHVLKYLYKKSSLVEEKNQQIKLLCQQVAEALEKISQANYGELGLDIGLDKNGAPWLIEVNSKPRKTTESEVSQVIVKNTFRRPLEYSTYLAGF